MVVLQLPMLIAWVRFPSPAPIDRRVPGTMIKFLKYLLKIAFALAVLGAISVVGIITLVDPNQFKDTIQKEVVQATGRVLTIHGPLYWQVDPNVSIEAHDLVLTNAPTFSNEFFTLKTLRIKPNLWALVSGKLWVNVHLDGLNLNLARDISGQANWQDLLQKVQKHALFAFPYNITLENAILNWQDAVSNQDLQFTNITASAQQLPLGAIGIQSPLSASFQLKDKNQDHSGQSSFKAVWCFNHKLQQLDIQNLEISTNFPDVPFATLMGELHIQNLQNTPMIQGKLHIPNLNLQYWLSGFNVPFYPVSSRPVDLKTAFQYQFPNLDVTSFTIALENEGSFSGAFKTNLSVKTLRTLSLNGAFCITG